MSCCVSPEKGLRDMPKYEATRAGCLYKSDINDVGGCGVSWPGEPAGTWAACAADFYGQTEGKPGQALSLVQTGAILSIETNSGVVEGIVAGGGGVDTVVDAEPGSHPRP